MTHSPRCGKLVQVPARGKYPAFTAKCTRFWGHEERAKDRPRQHFDQNRKYGWYEEKL